MPAIPSGTARREILRRTVWLAGAGCAVAKFGTRDAEAQHKLAKAEAHYQEYPNAQQHCAACAFYVAPVACRLVRGEVSPNGWCGLFRPKAA